MNFFLIISYDIFNIFKSSFTNWSFFFFFFKKLSIKGVRAAPLWCSNQQAYVGMLTITYFINVLINSYNNSDIKINELEEQKIENWKSKYDDASIEAVCLIYKKMYFFFVLSKFPLIIKILDIHIWLDAIDDK